jgi:NAD-dependent deacetylase sirtuin 1
MIENLNHRILNYFVVPIIIVTMATIFSKKCGDPLIDLDGEIALLADCIQKSQRIVVVTGAGISTSCGICDFRSPGGFYDRVGGSNSEVARNIFDIDYFRSDPSLFYKWAHLFLIGESTPSPTHHFIAWLEKSGKLLRNYTQNIDNLEKKSGITKLIQCHGSLGKFQCLDCRQKVNIGAPHLQKAIIDHTIAYCRDCQGILKPDIVFFGEDLPQTFQKAIDEDRKLKPDLIIYIGTSLQVAPVNQLPKYLDFDDKATIAYINNTELSSRLFTFHHKVVGDCDEITSQIQATLSFNLSNLLEPLSL